MVHDLLNTIRHEIDQRLSELRPLLAEHERLLVAADALLATNRDASAVATERRAVKFKPGRAARGAAREAILAALEHGSHTVGELAVVTAMNGPNINGNLRRLLAEGVVVKTKREGKAAWAVADALI